MYYNSEAHVAPEWNLRQKFIPGEKYFKLHIKMFYVTICVHQTENHEVSGNKYAY